LSFSLAGGLGNQDRLFFSLMDSAKTNVPVPVLPMEFIPSGQNISPSVEQFDQMASLPPNITGARQVISLAQGELRGLMQEREAIVKRITVLRQTIAGLVEIFGADSVSKEQLDFVKRPHRRRGKSMTQVCRAVLAGASEPLTAHELVEGIRAADVTLIQRQKNPIASVSSILGRLASSGEVRSVVAGSGRRHWVWTKSDENGRLRRGESASEL
jgi:hypothetical protein